MCLSMVPPILFLLANFLFQSTVNRSEHLESHIKLITQLEKPTGNNYQKNLPDGKSYFHVGWFQSLEDSTKDRLNPLRPRVPTAWRVRIKPGQSSAVARNPRSGQPRSRFVGICVATGLPAIMKRLTHGLRRLVHHTEGRGSGCVERLRPPYLT